MSTLRKSQSPQYHLASGLKLTDQSKGQKYSLLTQDQIQQIKEAFELFDPHSTGKITYHQLKIILRALGFDVKKSEVIKIAKNFDIQETGQIVFEDYTEIMAKKYSQRDPIQETLKAFRLFDTQGKGKISLNDLKKVAKQLGETLREQELMAMIDEFDRDGDGQIDEQQFLAIIKPSIV